MSIDQLLNQPKPTVEQQIDFVDSALSNELVLKSGECYNMLIAIKENLIAVRNWNEHLTKTLEEGSKEVSNG
jgi:hypothetical protein